MSKFAALAVAVNDAARMTIIHPFTNQPLRDADGKEAWIAVLSSDSEAAVKHQRAVTNRRLAMRNRNKVTAEEIDAEAIDLLAALTKGWRLLDLEGNPLEIEFTEANARELYGAPAFTWLREQVSIFAAERSNFSKASSQS